MTTLLDHGELRLLGHMASDTDVVGAARVSLGVAPEEASKGPEKDAKLIRFLMDNRHTTPFEHSMFRWYVRAPIFVFREWHRHRVGWSYNELSGRYAPLERLFYAPSLARVPDPRNRQSSVELWPPTAESEGLLATVRDACETAFDTYEALLAGGMARELARGVLPVNTYSAMWASCNAQSLMHFLTLRNHPAAQLEIRVYAQAMEAEFARIMPMTHAAYVAWRKYG